MAVPSLDSEHPLLSSPLDLPKALSKTRPFELSRRADKAGRSRIASDTHLDKSEADCQAVPAVQAKHKKDLMPHLLASHRVKTTMGVFLKEQAQIYDSQINYTDHDSEYKSESDDDEDMGFMRFLTAIQIARETNFDIRKFKMMYSLETLSFEHDVMLSIIMIRRTETETREEHINLSELKSAIAAAQMLITDFRIKLTRTHKSDDDTEKDIAILQSSLVSACSNVEDLRTKANFDEELVQPYCTAERRVCHAIGLEIDFVHRFGFDQLPEHITDHLSIEQWICNFLKENYKRERNLPEYDSLSDKELLERFGFRADGDAVNTLLQRASTLKEHLHTFDWAAMYVKDEFKYNPVLSGIRPKFPFVEDIREEWLILRMEERDNPQSNREVNVINLEGRNSTSYTKQDGSSSFPLCLKDGTHKILFHGTDHDSARHILIHGARITHGRKNRDFSSGSGFYLTDDFEHSVEWAFCSTSKPAVLVYRVNIRLLETVSGYSLIGEDKRSEWTDLVRQYRSGKPTKKLRKSVRGYDYIEGPRSSTCDAVSPKPNYGTYQMCVTSDELSEALDGSLHSAVFYGGN